MTDTQLAILRFIASSTAERGYPPTVVEIARAVGLRSSSSVQYQLDRLEGFGAIKREHGQYRTVRVLDKHSIADA